MNLLITWALCLASAAVAQNAGRGTAAPPGGGKTISQLIERGRNLFADEKLATNGKSCNSCHVGMGKGPGDGPMGAKPLTGRTHSYPKLVPMAGRAVTLDQMTQFCIVNPMKGKPLPWDSEELTALVAYQYSLTK